MSCEKCKHFTWRSYRGEPYNCGYCILKEVVVYRTGLKCNDYESKGIVTGGNIMKFRRLVASTRKNILARLVCDHDWYYDHRLVDATRGTYKGVRVCLKCGKVEEIKD